MAEEFENGMMRFRSADRHEGSTHWLHPNPEGGPKAWCRPAFHKRRSIIVGVPDGTQVTCRLCIDLKKRSDYRERRQA